MRAPLAPPRLSVPRNVDADAQAVETNCEVVRPELNSLLFNAAMSFHQPTRASRQNRILPKLGWWNFGAQAACDRSHVAMRQLVPRLCKSISELLGVVVKAF